MSASGKLRAKRGRETMRLELGNACAYCAITFDAADLEFDCIEPTGDRHHRMDSESRHYFYRAQQRAGNLQLLCRECHAEKSAWEHPARRELCPF